ncbi:TetR/AcrR family transcriptional regulator [Curtobacterium sp. MCBD17_040]|uniref:TetR/AcrR family transcriptional regulator n=1 Tax=Curtobacterium sp. MCBD17_040 TaxID=2175674 RepID=UPI000DA885BE|nr:TetR/AcrR family transcriptional regulator [Curtobacterium sp. MCBD17_040]WIB65934.1 TetR family transcriptional regulator [Curtobacterium sp. MCBD17_040]
MAQTTAWDRQRAAVRDEISRAAIDLFLRQGFEGTTIDQILESVGVSRRSFFRYFGTKEDVVLGDLVARGAAIAEALAARPVSEEPWDAISGAFHAADETTTLNRESTLALGRMLFDTPSLLARHLEKRLRWQDMLVPLIAARLADTNDRDLRAHAIVASALTCLDAASREWVQSGGRHDLADLYDQAVSAVRA